MPFCNLFMERPSYIRRFLGMNFICRIFVTGSAVALHCCKAYTQINRRKVIATACKVVTPKNFNLKLCTRDYIWKTITMLAFR